MSHLAIGRPEADEYAPFYADYIGRVPDGDLLILLTTQRAEATTLLGAAPEARGDFRYAEGKWSLKEVVGHLADAERVFGYRTLAIARGERASLPGFDHDLYVREGGFGRRPLASLARELDLIRASHLELFQSFDPATWRRTGLANGATISVRALAWVLYGHLDHHLTTIRERYLPAS